MREDFSSLFPSIFGVTPNKFKLQLQLISNEGDFIRPTEFMEKYDDLVSSKSNFFLVTFDDGLKEQFDFALPILDELGLEAIFFANSINTEEKRVSTVHKIHLLRSIISPRDLLIDIENRGILMLNSQECYQAKSCYRFDDSPTAEVKYLLNFKISFDKQEKLVNSIFERYFIENEVSEGLYMSAPQLQYLAKLNCLGSHTHSHYPLGLLGEDKLMFELEHSKNYLQRITKHPIQIVSYPYGTPEACPDSVAETAKNVGYSFGFTTCKGFVTEAQNKLLLNRFDCNDVIGGKNYGN